MKIVYTELLKVTIILSFFNQLGSRLWNILFLRFIVRINIFSCLLRVNATNHKIQCSVKFIRGDIEGFWPSPSVPGEMAPFTHVTNDVKWTEPAVLGLGPVPQVREESIGAGGNYDVEIQTEPLKYVWGQKLKQSILLGILCDIKFF